VSVKTNISPISDGTIVELFWSRDESAISEFERRYKPICMKLARDITGSAETAEECLNDLYLRLWNSIPPQKPFSLKSYACRIIRNLALNWLEKQHAQKRTAILVELDDCLTYSPSQSAMDTDSAELGMLIDSFLASLPKLDALIFVRRYFYSDSVKEIADKTGLPENRIYRILARSRKALKAYLTKGGIVLS